MRRGEVWWAHLHGPAGRRPVLLLSRDSMPQGRGEITVAYCTTTVRRRPVEVLLTPKDGMPLAGVVNLDSINTVEKSCLMYRVCTLSPAKMTEVKAALFEALDLKGP
jgi:mRNA-degrading endonuclease toxin of MazEF toxin-antitoxin module